MTVELDPKGGAECFSVGMPNQTWFDLVNTSEIKNHIGVQSSNDPVDATPEAAKIFAEITESWQPPSGWFSGIGAEEGKKMMIEFFSTCEGFTSS